MQDTAGAHRQHNGTSQGGEGTGGRTGAEGMPLHRDSRPRYLLRTCQYNGRASK